MFEGKVDMAGADIDGSASLERFRAILQRDADLMEGRAWLGRWVLADNHEARQSRSDMNFKGFEGHDHLRKFLTWNTAVKGKTYLPAAMLEPLAKISLERDMAVAAKLGIQVDGKQLAVTGRYNAQDYLFQRLYPVPQHQTVRTVLDFGPGLGRMANLAFGAPDTTVERMIAVDGIPSTYLTQRLYYPALGLRTAEYLDSDDRAGFDVEALMKDHQLIHLPTWQMDLIPSASVDLVICAQVLRELPQRLFAHVAVQFARVMKPGAALYIRDHFQFHNPNQMPQEEVLQAAGFTLEFRPHVRDRVDVHGIPRIWRRFDPGNYFND